MRLLDSFYIRTKDGERVRYQRKPAQLDFAKNKTGKDLILKARQLGFTTEEQLNLIEWVLTHQNITCASIAHKAKSAKKIFRIGKFAWDNLPELIRSLYVPKYDNVRELMFSAMGSNYFVDIEGRGETIRHLHVSEFAYIRKHQELINSTFEAVPEGGSIVVESTANGMNHFSDLWTEAVEGKNEWRPHFYNWIWESSYKKLPPETNDWKQHYKEIAEKENLIVDIQTRLNLTEEQFYWYFLKARRLKENVKQEYPSTPEEAFLTTGRSIFDSYELDQLDPKPIKEHRYEFEVFYEPEKDHEYVIGVDTAEGVDNDKTGIEIIDITDFKQVASFNDGNIRPDQTMEKALTIAKVYNNAFIIPERNSSGLTACIVLEKSGYRNVFINRSVDKKTKKRRNETGWRTMSSNRDLMIDEFIEIWENGNIEINSPLTISQMKTFVRKENGRREHDNGKHDDSLFALFLCVQGVKFHKKHKSRAFTRKPTGF